MVELLIVLAIVGILAALVFTPGCSNPDDAKKALLDAGYSDITMTGYAWLGCSDDDTYHESFTAFGPGGKERRVAGVVCGGWGKGWTIRLK